MKSLSSIIGNSQKLDGGAMFGHVPKALWSKWLTPDENNRITLATRALLIQENDQNILVETGIGAFFEPTMSERYGIEEKNHVLLDSLKKLNLSDSDIDIVILSHLHFDHAGGILSAWEENKEPTLLFPNAKFLVSKDGWERACNPHERDKASFVNKINESLKSSGRIVIINDKHSKILSDDYSFFITHGHTKGLLHTVIKTKDGPIIFASDLIPGAPWVHLPVGMGYDREAETLLNEKKELLEWALANNARLFFTHDKEIAMAYVAKDKSGKFTITKETNDFTRLRG